MPLVRVCAAGMGSVWSWRTWRAAQASFSALDMLKTGRFLVKLAEIRFSQRGAATRDAAPAGRGVCAVCGAGVGRDPPRPRPRPARARTRGVGPEDTHGRGTRDGRQSRPARVGCARQGASHLPPLTFLVSIYVIPLYGFKLRGAGAEAREAAPRRHRNKRRLRLPARARFWRVHVRSPLLHFRPMRPCTLVLRGSAGPGSVVAAGA